MRTVVVAAITAVAFGALRAVSAEDGAKASKADDGKVTVKVFTKADKVPETAKGLRVFCDGRIPATGKDAGQFRIRVVNLLDEEVFLQVTGFDDLGYDLRAKGILAVAGGAGETFPDNVHLLKRLHASSYQDGKRFTCGCCGASIRASIDPGHFESLIGVKGTVTVDLRGFLRSNGKEFNEVVELPVEIVKAAEGPEDGSAGSAGAGPLPEVKRD